MTPPTMQQDLAALLDATRHHDGGAHLSAVRARLEARLHGPAAGGPPEIVMIDGVRYVPVSRAHIAAPAIVNAIVGQWAGDDWRTRGYDDAPNYLRVIVTEDDPSEGESVTAFVARLLAGLEET